MDILKIRKKKREEEAQKEQPSTTSSSPAEPKPKKSKKAPDPAQPSSATSSSTPASPSQPSPSPPPSPSTSTSASASASPSTSPSVSTSRPPSAPATSPEKAKHPRAPKSPDQPPLILDDPLLEFLARYDEGADQMIVAASPEAPRDESKRYLAFELAGEEYAASIMEIREILRVLALTAVPRAPREILGVLSKRGLVMPVVDLAASLGLRDPDRTWSPRQRILVVGDGDRVCGLRVDRVLEVVRLSSRDVEEVPASLGSRSRHQLRGLGRVGERMFILLDVPAVLHAMAVGAGLEAREEVA